MSSRLSWAVCIATTMTAGILPLCAGAQVTASPLTRSALAPVAPRRQPLGSLNTVPAGISAQFVSGVNLGSTTAGTTIALGTVSDFQIQVTTPTAMGASREYILQPAQKTGSVQFAAGDQQAMQLYTCFQQRCVATLTVYNATPQSTINYTLGNVSFTTVNSAQNGVSATFTYVGLQSDPVGPTGVPLPAMSVPAGPATAPQGTSVTMQAPQGTVSLGMAATFQLQQSRPNPNLPATGSIQFAPNSTQALQLYACAINGCSPNITITYATPQGATVYMMGRVAVTSLTIGQATSVNFLYYDAQWQTFGPGSNQASQTGTM